MIRLIFISAILISLIIISQEIQDDIVSLLVNNIQQNTNITCLCTPDEKCELNTNTCRLTHPDHSCYESWTKEPTNNNIQVTAGCIYNEFFFTQIICHGNQTDRYIICCSNKDYCNDRDAYSNDIRKKLLSIPKPDKFLFRLILIPFIIIIILLLILCVFILFHIKQKRKDSSDSMESFEKKKNSRLFKYLFSRRKQSVLDEERDLDSMSIDSKGPADPLLRIITFLEQIVLEEKIGTGGYGSVYRGKRFEEKVAVKIFLSNDERSWLREVTIYETLCLNHENILRYIGSDIIDNTNLHCTERWLVTDYHENGSVYDYLRNHSITIPIMIKMMLSIANGLYHLHLPIDSRNGKVAIAHRDLKTKNILVKKDLSCCIADLGLAVREVRSTLQTRPDSLINNNNGNQEHIVIDIQANHRVGTYRYMAPEILNKTLNDQSFESYKATDIYALGLIYWEILRRCQTIPDENDADEYQAPYEDVLPNNPAFEEMYDVVCVRKIRPSFSSRWENNSIFRYIFDLCKELWAEEPACRSNSCQVKVKLTRQFELLNIELSNMNIEFQIDGPRTV